MSHGAPTCATRTPGTTRMRQDIPGCARTKPNTSSMRQSASHDDRVRKMRNMAPGCAQMPEHMPHGCQEQPGCVKIRRVATGQRLTQAVCDRKHQMRQTSKIVMAGLVATWFQNKQKALKLTNKGFNIKQYLFISRPLFVHLQAFIC